MNEKIQLAQLFTGSTESKEVIFKELLCMAVETMKIECQALDDYLQENPLFSKDGDWESVKIQLMMHGAGRGLDEATMLLIYMEYLEMQQTA